MGSVRVRHNFEAAHRLPALGGKCVNLHGHSWWVTAEFRGLVDPEGIIVDFGLLKKGIRSWIDTNLDHSCLLGHADPLVPALRAANCSLYEFGVGRFADGLAWPTVENVAVLLHRVCAGVVRDLAADGHVRVQRIDVQETHVNSASVEHPEG